eukprot:Gb_26140 [translate_table: standard]
MRTQTQHKIWSLARRVVIHSDVQCVLLEHFNKVIRFYTKTLCQQIQQLIAKFLNLRVYLKSRGFVGHKFMSLAFTGRQNKNIRSAQSSTWSSDATKSWP